jgi:hypothetical protein
MATAKWTTPIAIETVLSTDLNSLANGYGEVPGGASATYITVDSLLYADLELVVQFGTNPVAGSLVEVYFIRRIDSTTPENYTRGASAVGPANGYAGGFPLAAVTSAQRIILPQVTLPPTDFIFMVINRSGQTMAASGNTVKMRRYSEQSA